MKYAIHLITLLLIVNLSCQNELTNNYRDLTYIYSDSVSTWVSVENSSTQKWCKSPTVYSSGYNWTTGDATSYWSTSSGYIWSNDSTRFTNNAKKLLWPLSNSYWNTQSYSLSSQSQTKLII